MNYKVGDRVRLISCASWALPIVHAAIGREFVIAGLPGSDRYYPDQYVLEPSLRPPSRFCALSSSLAPLTDPKADAFLESIRKLEREPLVMAKLFQGEIA